MPNGLLAASSDLRRDVCWMPTGAASSPGTAAISRCSGGARIRGWCCSSTNSASRARYASDSSSNAFEIRVDTAFRDVMEACAERASIRAVRHVDHPGDHRCVYRACTQRGYAHSVEAWRDGELVGGLYGVAIGRMFFGESMFALEPDASKIALVQLVEILRALGCPLIDCQQETVHLATFGARPIPRRPVCRARCGVGTLDSSPRTPGRSLPGSKQGA